MNLRNKAKIMIAAGPSSFATNPKQNTETPMRVSENPTSLGCPKSSIILATWGEKITLAIEKAAKTIPTY